MLKVINDVDWELEGELDGYADDRLPTAVVIWCFGIMTLAHQVVLHPGVTGTLKVWSTTVGRDKTYRALQYFARFYAWYLYRTGATKEAVARWSSLKVGLGQGRKLQRINAVMRVGKWAEHLQAAMRALNTGDPVLRFTAIGRQLGYALYLFNDSFVWAHAANVRRLTPEAAKNLNDRAMKLWFTGIAFSIASGLYATRGLMLREAAAKRARASPEKEAERKAELKAVSKQRAAVRFQLVQDCLDIVIPASTVGWLNLDEGLVGLAGLATSLMGLQTQTRAVLGTVSNK